MPPKASSISDLDWAKMCSLDAATYSLKQKSDEHEHRWQYPSLFDDRSKQRPTLL